MDLFDLIIIVLAALAAFGGYRLGFLARALSWIGMAAGVYVAVRLLGRIVSAAHLASADSRLVVAALVLLAGAFVGQALGMLVGARMHQVLPLGPLRSLDKVVGAAVGVLGVTIALWLLLPSISSVAGWPARFTRDSAISRWIANDLPRPPDPLESLRGIIGTGAFPQVFDALHPGEAVGDPPSYNPLGATVTSTISASTVKVEGQACDRLQEGSGFAIRSDLVLTNAHVVAGEPAGSTSVILPSGAHKAATVVLYDPDRDLALLEVPGLDERPLTLGTGRVGSKAAVFGHPGGQTALAVQPATIAQQIVAVGEDLYDRHRTSRNVFVLAAKLEPGDSGSPLVDRQGRVVGVAFAIALDRSDTAYALTTSEVRQDLRVKRTGQAISTEGCVG
jgi:S1-C subfamily serine protease